MAESTRPNWFWLLIIGAVLGRVSGVGTDPAPVPPVPDDVAPAPADPVAEAFDRYETHWRQAQGVLAEKLEAGEIRTEREESEWFRKANGAAMAEAFGPLLEIEEIEFGGEQWTPEKRAAVARRYGFCDGDGI